MRKFLAAVSALALLPGAAHAADDSAPHVFKPSGAWTADFGEDYCRLSRPFSDGAQQLTVAMERVEPVNRVRVVLIGSGVKVYRSADQFENSHLPSRGSRKGPFWRSETADKQQFLSMGEIMVGPAPSSGPGGPGAGGPPPAPDYSKPAPFPPYDRAGELKFAEGINALAITGGVTAPVEINTGGLKAPVDVLQKCADDLLTYWGLDAARHQTMTRAAQPSMAPSEWLPSGAIGFGDFAKLGDSANQLRLLVSAEGKPTACAVIRPSLEARTNDTICKALMAKAQFFPALDAQGQAMASYWVTSPMFLMPPFRT